MKKDKDSVMTHLFRSFLGALLALGLVSQAALAHSSKEGTRPTDGSVLATSPEKFGMTFDMPMRVTLVSLTDQDDKEHERTREDNIQSVKVFDVTPPNLLMGSYTVQWRELAEDGHPMQGTFSFQVTE